MAGTATLYGRFATTAVGSEARSSGPMDSTSRLITVESLDLAVRMLGHRLRQPLGQHRVDLDGADRTATVQQCKGERAEAGADFQDVVVAVDSGGRHDPAHGVGVVNEVLPQRFTRS